MQTFCLPSYQHITRVDTFCLKKNEIFTEQFVQLDHILFLNVFENRSQTTRTTLDPRPFITLMNLTNLTVPKHKGTSSPYSFLQPNIAVASANLTQNSKPRRSRKYVLSPTCSNFPSLPLNLLI